MFRRQNLMMLLMALLCCAAAGCQSQGSSEPLTGAEAEQATQEYHEQVDQQESSQQAP